MLTDRDRSDIMMDVFDDLFFEGMPFGEMPRVVPKILTTNLTTERGFIVSDQDFATLDSRPDLPPGADSLGKTVNGIDTAYRLQAAGTTSAAVQDALFAAARILAREDVESRRQACGWFRDHGFHDFPCLGEGR